ncbi:MAG: hypothetical protein ACFC1C_00825 [Candidatus Malihini olakiniferum]
MSITQAALTTEKHHALCNITLPTFLQLELQDIKSKQALKREVPTQATPVEVTMSQTLFFFLVVMR